MYDCGSALVYFFLFILLMDGFGHLGGEFCGSSLNILEGDSKLLYSGEIDLIVSF